MPHIKSKTTGRIFHDVDSQTAALFVDAKLADYFEPAQLGSKPAPLPKIPTFAVIFNSERNKFEIVCTLPSGVVQRFAGEPREAKNAFKALAWSATAQARVLQGPEPPANVLGEYAEVFGRPSAEAYAYARSKEEAEAARTGAR